MPRNKYPEETVQKILDVSFRLFMEKGYENTTVLDIVENLGGLTRGAFYHHFKSKEEVMDALTDKMFIENNPFEKIKQEKNLNALQKFQKLLNDSLEETEYKKICGEAVSLMKNPRFLAEMIESNQKIVTPFYQELIEEGNADGSIKVEYPRQVAEVFTFLTNFWMLPTVFPFTREEGIARIHLIKQITESMGLPVIDDDLLEGLMHTINEIE